MPTSPVRRIGSFLSPQALAHLAMPPDLSLLPEVSGAWEAAAGEPLCRHVQATRYLGGRLTLCADSSVWAGRVRYQQQALLARLRLVPVLRRLTGLHVRIVPLRGRSGQPPRAERPQQPSAASCRLLQQVAGHIEDPGLRAALVRLSRGRSGDGS